ncbi:CCA tRNA nucleotidyltransferase [bacterium]|nr:CCA tRNA nucleotidyltransferase [bacterium]
MANRGQQLLEELSLAFPVERRHIFDRLRAAAQRSSLRIALVGGLPREILRCQFSQRERENLYDELRDIDIVVEGDAIRFARELYRNLPGELVVNEDFGTATLTTEGVEIDLTSSRRESYAAPGQLPEVDTSGVRIEADLGRRDFTVNAVALELNPDYGAMLDPLGGEADLRNRQLRILHSASFHDDPTRLFRALRYSIRLNAELEPVSMAAFGRAIEEDMLATLTPERVRYELHCISREERWHEIWAVMDLAMILPGLHEALGGISSWWTLEQGSSLDIVLRNQKEVLEGTDIEPWLVRVAWTTLSMRDTYFEAAMNRIGIFPRHIRAMVTARHLLVSVPERLSSSMRPSEVVDLLEHFPRDSVALAFLVHMPVDDRGVSTRRALLNYLLEYSQVRPMLSGHELIRLGIPAGPAVGECHRRLRAMRLDGHIDSEEDERNVVLRMVNLGEPGADQASGDDG